MTLPPGLLGRAITVDDLDAVMAIERRVHVQPWSRPQFAEDLARDGALLYGLWEGAHLVGYIDYWRTPDEVEILNVATDPERQRQGIASYLMHHAIADARAHHRELVRLEVRRGNQAAQALYRKLGFRAVGVRPSYYRDLEDAIVMTLAL